jgi:Putative prokaryotic signal transducing protein
VESFPNAYVAEMAKGILNSYGIERFIKKSEEESTMSSGTMQLTDLWVHERDYQRAKKLLRVQFKE